MKKLLLSLCFVLLMLEASAWGSVGHEAIVELAKMHLTKKTRKEIARFMPYDIAKDASWMDDHRADEAINYTTHWHSFGYNTRHEYDVNRYLRRGDVLRALHIADHNLTRYQELTDSAVVMNLRMILHFVGDMHCPTHANPPFRGSRKPITVGGKSFKKFHSLYDAMPELVHPNRDPQTIAEKIDILKSDEQAKVTAGSFLDWANEIASQCSVIYEWVPVGTEEIDPGIIEQSTDLVNMELRNAGYRLAAVLNRYFDPQPQQ